MSIAISFVKTFLQRSEIHIVSTLMDFLVPVGTRKLIHIKMKLAV